LDAVELTHMNGRVQDPELGRFLSADPFVQAPYHPQSLNRYSYVWNNPLTFVDPSGFQAEWDVYPTPGPHCGKPGVHCVTPGPGGIAASSVIEVDEAYRAAFIAAVEASGGVGAEWSPEHRAVQEHLYRVLALGVPENSPVALWPLVAAGIAQPTPVGQIISNPGRDRIIQDLQFYAETTGDTFYADLRHGIPATQALASAAIPGVGLVRAAPAVAAATLTPTGRFILEEAANITLSAFATASGLPQTDLRALPPPTPPAFEVGQVAPRGRGALIARILADALD
jgi:RHS repeat-associated protein